MPVDGAALVALVNEARPHVEQSGAETEAWLDRLEQHREELRALVEELADTDIAAAADLAAGIWRYWWLRGHLAEGRAILERVSAASDPPPMGILKGLGMLAYEQGDLAATEAAFNRRLSLALASGDRSTTAEAYADLARTMLRQGQISAARQYADRGYMAARGGAPEALRLPLHLRAATAHMEGQLDTARALYLESRQLNEKLGNSFAVAAEDHNLGHVALDAGDRDDAERHFRAFAGWLNANDDAYLRPYLLLDGSVLALHDGEVERAARLFGAAQRMFEEEGAIPDADERVVVDRTVERLRRELGARMERLTNEGRAWTPAEARAATGL